jgi:hypothetical protein
LILGRSIVAHNCLEMSDLISRYLLWYKTDSFDTGPVWRAVFKKISEGVDPKVTDSLCASEPSL